MGRTCLENPQATNGHVSRNTNCNSNQIIVKANEHPEWLPDGWNVDVRIRKSGVHVGSEYKCYIEPSNGFRFYSKPEVLRYLETVKGNSCTSKKEKRCTNLHSPSKVCTTAIVDLPPGWIKEVKVRKNVNGIRKDPYYIDPVSGYVFRSKKDALRYLQSGDISTCVFKPYKREMQDEDMFTPSSAAKRQKLKQSATRRQLFIGREISDKSSLELPDANSSKGVADMKVSAEMMVVPVPTDETVVNMHSQGDVAADLPEMIEKSNPGRSALLKIESLKESDKMFSADAGLDFTPLADVQEKDCIVNEEENGNKKNQSNPSISRNKKDLSVPHRFSKRLAGIEPSQVADTVGHEQALQVPERYLRKSRRTTNADLANKSSQQFNVVPEFEHVHIASCMNMPMQGESLNKCDKPSEDQRMPCRASKRLAGFEPELMNNSIYSEKPPEYKSRKSKSEVNTVAQQSEGGAATELADHDPANISALINGESSKKRRKSSNVPDITDKQVEKVGDEEIYDEKSGPQLSFAFHYSWSDPCLEFAIKTLTGVLPIEDTVGNGPNLVPETDVFGKNKLCESSTKSTRDRNPQVNSKKHKNKKELRLPRRLSKRLAGHEPELVPAERPLEYATRKSYKDEPTANVLLNNGASEHLDASNETEHIVHASDGSKATGVHGEPSNKSNEVQTVPEEQLQKPEAEKIGDQRSNVNLNNGASEHLGTSKETEHSVHASYSSETRVHGEPLNKSEKPHEAQTVPEERLQRLEAGKVGDQRSNVNLNNGACEHLDTTKETEHSVHASDSSETRRVHGEPLNKSEKSHEAQTVLEEQLQPLNKSEKSHEAQTVLEEQLQPLNKSEKSYEAQTVPEEQLQKPEAEKIGDQRSEPQLSLPFGDSWSDPCLEFAIKTLTGALSVEATANVLPVMSPSVSAPPNQDLLESVVEKSINEEVHDNTNQSKNKKEFNLVWEPSKQNLGQPELRTNSASCENASNFATRESYCDEAYDITRSLDEGNSPNIEGGNMTQLNHHSRNINMFTHEEPAKKIGQVLEGDAVPAEQSQLETLNNENPESHFCAPFIDSWSDPCLEFAFKTLTGVIPVEENLAIQGCFQGPANCHGPVDGGSTLPDFVSPSFSQSDISSHHDMGEKSMPGQQPSTSSSFLPLENVSVHDCSGVDSRKPYPHYNKKF